MHLNKSLYAPSKSANFYCAFQTFPVQLYFWKAFFHWALEWVFSFKTLFWTSFQNKSYSNPFLKEVKIGFHLKDLYFSMDMTRTKNLWLVRCAIFLNLISIWKLLWFTFRKETGNLVWGFYKQNKQQLCFKMIIVRELCYVGKVSIW